MFWMVYLTFKGLFQSLAEELPMELEGVEKFFALKPEESVTLKGQSEVVLKAVFRSLIKHLRRSVMDV